jgi:hypothetical protein
MIDIIIKGVFMSSISFENWQRDSHLLYNKYIFKTEGENSRWGRLLCTWHEKDKESAKNLEHHVCYCVDLTNGDLYVDDSKTEIYLKMLGVISIRIAQVFSKTFFHLLLPVSPPIIFYTTIQHEVELNKKRDKEDRLMDKHTVIEIGLKCVINSVESMAHIIKTPLYGLAMVITSLVAIIAAPFDSTLLYDCRKLAGKFEDKMYQGSGFKKEWGLYTQCFHPHNNIEKLYKQKTKDEDHTDYSNCKDLFEINLSCLARNTVLFYRSNEQNDLFHCFPTSPYNSASYAQIESLKK